MNPEDLLAYVDGELDPASRDRVERELQRDPAGIASLAALCRQRMQLAEAAREERRALQAVEVSSPRATSRRRIAAVPAARSARPRRVAVYALAAAAAVAFVIGTALFLSERGTTKPADGAGNGTVVKAPADAGPLREVIVKPRQPLGRPSLPEAESRPDRDFHVPPPSPPAPTVVERKPDPSVPPPDAAADPPSSVAKKAPDAPPASDPPPPAPKTVAPQVLARFESFSGKVQVLRGVNNSRILPAARDAALVRGDAIQVLGNGRAVIRYPDFTQLEIGSNTTIALTTHTGDTLDGDGRGIAKKIFLRSGALAVGATPQPEGLPLLLVTSQAEVRVLGTRFTLDAGHDATRLEVLEGRVRMTRRHDGNVIEVRAGQHASAAHRTPLRAMPMRSDDGLLALYRFDEGNGVFAVDRSRAGEPLPLRVANPHAVSWLAGSLLVHNPTVVATPVPATKVIRACQASRELTVEAWVRQRAGGKGGYVVALASNPYNLDFLLEQTAGETYVFHVRTSKTRENGSSVTARGPAEPDRPVHIVYTRAASGMGVLYLNGTRRAEHVVPGDFSRWDHNYRLALAGDAKGRRPWLGEIQLVAVYKRALQPDEVARHYRAEAR